MAVIEKWFRQDLQKPVVVHHLDGSLFSHNGNGNKIGVELYNGGEPLESITGTVSGYVVVSDGTTVPCTGAKSGNRASILIPAAAYVPGNVFVSIFVTDDTTVTTVAAMQSTVLQTRTGTQVDPGTVVADWTQTINAAMQEVETAAEDLAGIIATPYASLTYPVPLGKYTYYNGGLYRCITPIATSETWTAAHWTAVKLGDDVSNLKSAIGDITGNEIIDNFRLGKRIPTNVSPVDPTNFVTNTSGDAVAVPCVAGDVFTLTGKGFTSAGYLYAFIDANGAIKSHSSSGQESTDLKLTAPADSVYLIVNVTKSSNYKLVRGWKIKNDLADLRNKALYSIRTLTATDNLNDITEQGIYGWTGANAPINAPAANNAGKMLVISKLTNPVIQVYFSEQNSTLNSMYYRVYASGWHQWHKVARTTDIEDASNAIMEIITNDAVTATGVPARVIAAAEGTPESISSTATTLVKYRGNLMTMDRDISSKITIDENGAFVLNTTVGSSSVYLNIQTGILLKGGVTYRVDGSPRTNDNCALCLYDTAGDRHAYDQSHNGATYTPESDTVVRLCLRVMADTTYENVKFYPILCENANAERITPEALTLDEGENDIVGLDFAPVTITYRQSKLELLENQIKAVETRIDNYPDVMSLIKENADADNQYTSSFVITLPLERAPTILTITAQYSGADAPTVQIRDISSSGGTLMTFPAYVLGGTREPTRHSWRLPPITSVYNRCTVTFTIPSGTSVAIRDADIRADQRNRYNDLGIKFHGHAGALAPANSVESFQLGAELGYNTMITIPKFTADGIGVCFHDDGSISGDLCWMNGTSITGEDDKAISQYTYAELTENFRLKSLNWGVLHVPTLDDYFRVCSLTGMNPIFSVHSTGLGMSWTDGFTYIRNLAIKWNVLNKVGIKSGNATVQSAARSIFGTDIDCYIFLTGQGHAPLDMLTVAKSAGFVSSSATDLTGCPYRLIAEYFYSQTIPSGTWYTETMAAIPVELVRGFKISVAETSVISGAEMHRLIDAGVTEFTVDAHISMGLDW